MITTLTLKKKYQEDISVLATGTELIAFPCVVYDIIISKEIDGDAIVSFSDSITSYAVASRCLKVVTTAEEHTVHHSFTGLVCTSGFSATSNLASVDVTIVYE